ncbi:hypothetical protein HHK36_028046 [Tetracentron sinense]|uniref:Uncharacterized protein n=1 Tax=Tetracentron sinense TaxID=13715 RepID=A0A834YE72_TETSI|nr:hypothetical protein HHK36_028046 [Tetracentron sinense]
MVQDAFHLCIAGATHPSVLWALCRYVKLNWHNTTIYWLLVRRKQTLDRLSRSLFILPTCCFTNMICNSGSTTKDGDAFKYLELEELPDDSRVETSYGQTNETVSDETVSGTVSEAEFSTPTIEVSGIVSEAESSTPTRELRSFRAIPEFCYEASYRYLIIAVLDSAFLLNFPSALQVSVRVRDKADHSVKSIDDLLTHFKEEVAVFH